jgi:cardiolipin synthase
MFRKRPRRARKPRVYRISVETYLVALAIAFALSTALTLLNRPRQIAYGFPHLFSVRDATFLASAHALSDPCVIAGNRVTILANGDAFFPAMLSAIAGARQSVNLESYIFWSGTVADRFRDALAERASHGVAVRILLDAVGSGGKVARTDVEALRRAGCVVDFFHPLHPWMLDSINNRTHRRILVVDGKVGFTGGAGIADVWLGNAQAPGRWRDTQVRVEGPVVAQLQAAFQDNWAEAHGEALLGEKYFPRLEPSGSALCQVILSSPRTANSAVKLLYAVSISSASRNIYLSNSYFLPEEDSSALLVAAARRGVDVKILVPGKVNDVPATKAGGRSAFGALLAGGVKIYEYQPTMFHPKTMVVDGIFATIGSTNFDHRSFHLNDEINLTVFDEPSAHRLEGMFLEDLGKSRPYTYAEWLKRPWKQRLVEWVILPLRSEL